VQAPEELKPDLHHVARRQGLAGAGELVDQVAEGATPHPLHREKRLTGDFADFEHVDDVGMPKALEEPRLGEEHLDEIGFVEVLSEHPLQDAETVAGVERDEELPHAAAGEALYESVSTERRQLGIGHGPGVPRGRQTLRSFICTSLDQ